MASESSLPAVPMPRKAGAYTFAAIFAVESLARALNSTVVSLQAYDILGTSQKVSVLSSTMSLIVLITTLLLPQVLGSLRRRWAYTLGVVLLMLASFALATHVLLGQAAGMWLRNTGAAVMNITLSLYILDHIKRTELARSEPLRLSLSTFSWMIGPALGVWLYVGFGPWGPQLAVIATTLTLLALFWYLRLHDHSGVMPQGNLQKFNPLRNVKRFIDQPRLRLAWAIAFGRSCFWTTFFIYGPLMVVESGLPKNVGGVMISASQAVLLSAWFSGKLARQYGVRSVIASSFALASVAAVAAGIAGTSGSLCRHRLPASGVARRVMARRCRGHSLSPRRPPPRTSADDRSLSVLHRFLRTHPFVHLRLRAAVDADRDRLHHSWPCARRTGHPVLAASAALALIRRRQT